MIGRPKTPLVLSIRTAGSRLVGPEFHAVPRATKSLGMRD